MRDAGPVGPASVAVQAKRKGLTRCDTCVMGGQDSASKDVPSSTIEPLASDRPVGGPSNGPDSAEGAVLALMERVHARLTERARALSSEERARQSFCREWSVAEVYSHLGSGAQIGTQVLEPARSGGGSPDPWKVWEVWNAKSPTDMVDDFARADRTYLDALGGAVEASEAGEGVVIPIDGRPWPLVVALTARLVELALHEWDVAVVDDPSAEVDADSAAWLLAAFPLDVAAQGAAADVASRLGSATLAIEIADPKDRLRLDVTDGRVRLQRVPAGGDWDGVLALPHAASWVRLISGRWRPQLDDRLARTSGRVPPAVLTELFPGF